MAYQVCKRSILNYNGDVKVYPIKLKHLEELGLFTRPRDPKQATEFTYTRFLVPYLNNYEGRSLFCDSDFLWRCDVLETVNFIDDNQSVSCVQHSYDKCLSSVKMDGLKQEWYPRKNWSSLMLFNCSHGDCRRLTPKTVSTETARYLHRLEWADDKNVGSMPSSYNHLVGYYEEGDPKAVHFTDGGPWHKDYQNVPHADEWLAYLSSSEKARHKNGDFWRI